MQHHGSMIWKPYTEQFDAYQEESKVLSESGLEELLNTREAQTQALQLNPKLAQLWVARAQTYLSFRYPELCAHDAHRALCLLEDPLCREKRMKSTRSRAALLLCGSLFFTRSFKDCLHFIQTFRERSNLGQAVIESSYLIRLRKLRSFATECLAQQRQDDANDDTTPHEYGEIQAAGYPWISKHHLERNKEVRAAMSSEISKASNNTCIMRRSRVPSSLVDNCYGMYANFDIYEEEETIFMEKPALVASDHVDRKCCDFCFVLLGTEKETNAVEAVYCKPCQTLKWSRVLITFV
jgi:hypothetical protein